MTNYAITTQYLINLFKSDELVNTILFGTVDGRELNKNDIYPLVHIMPSTVSLEGNRINIGYDLAVVNVRQVPNHFKTDKIFGDNLIDNLNEASQILIKALTKLELSHNPHTIDIESSSAAQPIVFADINLLDGFECSIVLSIQNELAIC